MEVKMTVAIWTHRLRIVLMEVSCGSRRQTVGQEKAPRPQYLKSRSMSICLRALLAP
jgi:hypothetical protein